MQQSKGERDSDATTSPSSQGHDDLSALPQEAKCSCTAFNSGSWIVLVDAGGMPANESKKT